MHFKQISRLGHFFSKIPKQNISKPLEKGLFLTQKGGSRPSGSVGGEEFFWENFSGGFLRFCVFLFGRDVFFFFKLDEKTAM